MRMPSWSYAVAKLVFERYLGGADEINGWPVEKTFRADTLETLISGMPHADL
jgi:hypothetical protein